MRKCRNSADYLILLAASVLNGEAPPELPQELDFNEVFDLAKCHDIANITFYAVEKLKSPPPEKLMKEWAELRDRAIVKDIVQQDELGQICEALESAGIRHVPLKGALLKFDYPQTDMRSMSDLDILIDEQNAGKAKEIMLSLGYHCEGFGNDIEDTYFKEPHMNVELHRSLILEGFSDDYERLFADPWSECTESDGYCLKFRGEYFFAYVLAHAMKHYENAGTGIRSFMDLYVYERKYPEEAKKAVSLFQEKRIKKLAEDFMKLAESWFSGEAADPSLSEMEKFVISSGTYGVIENSVIYRVKNKGKAAYLAGLIFPSLKTMRNEYRVLHKAPFLLPVFWIVRICTKPFIYRKENMAKLKALKNYKKEDK